ncbi:hypothetical protein V501_09365, partial [Pseudogymnoascus sp. VKM F-4519 (FW-2642)]
MHDTSSVPLDRIAGSQGSPPITRLGSVASGRVARDGGGGCVVDGMEIRCLLSYSAPSKSRSIMQHTSKSSTPSSSGTAQSSPLTTTSSLPTTNTTNAQNPSTPSHQPPLRSGWASKNISTLPIEPTPPERGSYGAAGDAAGTAGAAYGVSRRQDGGLEGISTVLGKEKKGLAIAGLGVEWEKISAARKRG